jgi:predicted nucleic acid-binding protein
MELLVKPIKHGLEANVLAFLTSTPHLIHIDINLAVAREAAKIRARLGFRTPDALIVATGIVHKVKYLVTNDGAWKKRLTHPSLPTVIMLSDFV